jgi:hypothetical protein
MIFGTEPFVSGISSFNPFQHNNCVPSSCSHIDRCIILVTRFAGYFVGPSIAMQQVEMGVKTEHILY